MRFPHPTLGHWCLGEVAQRATRSWDRPFQDRAAITNPYSKTPDDTTLNPNPKPGLHVMSGPIFLWCKTYSRSYHRFSRSGKPIRGIGHELRCSFVSVGPPACKWPGRRIYKLGEVWGATGYRSAKRSAGGHT